MLERVLNDWVTDTNETSCVSNSSISWAKSQRAGQTVDFVHHHDIDPAAPNIGQQPLQGRPFQGSP
jgi:hypothetical protein